MVEAFNKVVGIVITFKIGIKLKPSPQF